MSATERRNPGNPTVGERRSSDVQRIADALRIRGRVLLRTYGSSMLPWMRPGDISRVRRTSVENVRCGDLVLFRRHNHLFVHRIVDERMTLGVRQVSAKGDAHPKPDGCAGPRGMYLSRWPTYPIGDALANRVGTRPRATFVVEPVLVSRGAIRCADVSAHAPKSFALARLDRGDSMKAHLLPARS